ncbi:MAG: hypothetical protein ACK5PW_10310 [Burkholderiales bacterium]|jgi:hypothetical protein
MFERLIRSCRFAVLAIVAPLSLAAGLSACGGEGAGAGGGAAASGAGIGTVQVAGSTTTIDSDGKTPVDLTVFVTSGSNVAAKNVLVDLSASDPTGAPGGVRVEVLRSTTDSTGTATARLTVLSDPRSRDISVVANAGGVVSAPLKIRVGGTTINASGPSAISLAGSAVSNYTVSLKDSSGAPLPGWDVTAASATGNTLIAKTVKTDSGGQAVFGVRGAVPGSDTLTFSALGESRALPISVSGKGLSMAPSTGFATVGSTPVVALGTTASLLVTYQSSDGIPGGTIVDASTTRGTLTPSSASIATGTANFSVSSSFAGPATVTARVGGVSSEYTFNFVSVTPSQIDLQAGPSTIGPNLGGSTEQRATLTAVVRDVRGNPVANRIVSFSAIDDPSGGSIQPGIATTDLAGRATVLFIGGPTTTAVNAVKLVATVDGISSQTAFMSVARSQLFVRLGTDNKIEKVEPALYRKTYAVVVTDSTGNAVKNASVVVNLRPLQYRTGRWVQVSGGPPEWGQNITGTFPSEDIDRDGICKAGEDTNGDGQLTPGNVASTAPAVNTTDTGTAAVVLQYPRSFAQWVQVLLDVRVQVAGSEGAAVAEFWLPISADDLADKAVAPPGGLSPFPFPVGTDYPRTCP